MIVLQHGSGSLLLIIFAWFFPSLVIAEIVNRTIDDTFGDSQTGLKVTYRPSDADVWHSEQDCRSICKIKPDVANAFNRTYMAATSYPSSGSVNITMQFVGTAIYVFFILANDEDALTVANFALNENPPQVFSHLPSLTSDIEYNQLVFSKINLANTPHTLVISSAPVNETVWLNFDYAIYTYDNDAPLSPLTGHSSNMKSKSSTIGRIVGGVLSAVALISFLMSLYLCRKRIKQIISIKGNVVSPYILTAPSVSQSTGPPYGAVKGMGMLGNMRDRLRLTRAPVVYSQDQQHFAKVEELSDIPPPSYTIAMTAPRH